MGKCGIVGEFFVEWGIVTVDSPAKDWDVYVWDVGICLIKIKVVAQGGVDKQVYSPRIAIIAETEFWVVLFSEWSKVETVSESEITVSDP